MIVMLLTKHHLEFLSLKKAAEARLSLYLSKYHIFGNQVSQLINDSSSTLCINRGLKKELCVCFLC